MYSQAPQPLGYHTPNTKFIDKSDGDQCPAKLRCQIIADDSDRDAIEWQSRLWNKAL